MITRHFKKAALSAMAATVAIPGFSAMGQAAEYPSRPITLIIGYKAGGGTDTVGRVMAKAMGKALGQQTNVVNKPGAGGGVAAMKVMRAKADGYTLLMDPSSSITFGPLLNTKLRYTPADFVYAGMMSAFQPGLVAPMSAPYNNLTEFVAWAKKNPGAKYATLSPGSRMVMEVIAKAKGLRINYVPVKGGAGMLNVVLGKQVDIAYTGGIHTRHPDTIKLIVSSMSERHPSAPNVPTLIEDGINVTTNAMTTVAAPLGTSPKIIAKLEAAMLVASKDPALLKILSKVKFPLFYRNAADATKEMQAQWVSYQALVKSTGYKAK